MGLAVEQSLCRVTAPYTGVGPVHLWVPAAPAEKRSHPASCPCKKPLAAPAMSTVR